jgi:chromosome segregation protein
MIHNTSQLMLSIQLKFPNPFYILDEIDTFLDSRTALRIGHILHSQSLKYGTQFVVISHRPEMQISASRIIGLYHLNGCITGCSVYFYEEKEHKENED